MAFVSGVSPLLGRKTQNWAFDPTYTGYTAPDSPDTMPSENLPGPVSSLLPFDAWKAIAKHSTGFQPMGPTTTWADVADQSVREQQRRVIRVDHDGVDRLADKVRGLQRPTAGGAPGGGVAHADPEVGVQAGVGLAGADVQLVTGGSGAEPDR